MEQPMEIGRIFDLHCDTLSECARQRVGLVNDRLQFSLDRVPPSYHICQAAAVFMPDELRGREAVEYFGEVLRVYRSQMEALRGTAVPIEDPGDVERALEGGCHGIMLTVEGGSALGGELANVEWLYKQGVRMMTLTWNAANEICGGVETNLGFTPFGRRVIGEMERLGMVVDVSHLSDRGFYQLCEFAKRPFAASHSNSRAVCPHPRNLTDDMFRRIVERGGVVGLNYHEEFITEGKSGSVDDLLRHVHHFLELGGEKTMALGSDFDGAEIPPYLDRVEKVDTLRVAMERSGIPRAVVEDIFFGNARRYFAGFAPVPAV